MVRVRFWGLGIFGFCGFGVFGFCGFGLVGKERGEGKKGIDRVF